MRIDELYLTAFGRFRGRRLALGPGLTVLYGPNESGKTTIQKFLLGMLYGFKKPGLRREYTADAARYRPWEGGGYRGSLIYTLGDGQTFRVEREFEPGSDGLHVYDHRTGADLTARFPMDRRREVLFAEAHVGLSEEAFRATAWVGQLAVGQMEAARELVARVANLQESGREDLSVQAALDALRDRAKAIGTERAVTSLYGRTVRAMAETRQALERAEGAREAIRDWEARLTEVRAVLDELDGELAELGGQWQRAVLAEAEAKLDRVTATNRRVRELWARAEELERRERPSRGQRAGRSSPGPALLGSAAVLVAAAVLAGVVIRQGWVATILGMAGLASAALWFHQRSQAAAVAAARREQSTMELARAQDEAEGLEGALQALLGAETPESLAADVERLRAETPAGPPPARSAAVLQEEVRRLEARRADHAARASDLAARVETALRDVPDTADLRRALADLAEEKEAYEAELAAIDLAARTITEVAGEIHREFAPRLGAALGGLAGVLTGGRYRSVQVDEEAAMRVLTEDDRTVELTALSGGTADQLYLGLRLALLDLLTEGQERAPLLLDDPFVQYDDARAAAALSLLAGIARSRQVLVLTCHRREADLARGMGASVIELVDAAAEGTA